jgi:hemolysin activation/secretion protein
VAKLSVTGARFHLPSQVREAMPSVAPGSVPNFNEMQEELGRVARASADREITPIVAAGEQPGTMAVELKVLDTLPLHGSLELNDKQSQGTAAGRLEAGLSYDNLFQRGHSLGFNWFYSPGRPSEANIQSLNYSLPLGGAGDKLTLGFTHSDSNTPTPLGGQTVSRGNTYRLRWRDELPTREGLSHGLSLGATLKHLRDANEDVAGFSTPAPDLHYPTFQFGYDLDLQGTPAGRLTQLQAELSVSLQGLSRRVVDCNGEPREQFACKRVTGGRDVPSAARAGFQVFTLSLSHREPIGRWQLAGRLQAQISDTPLVSAEQVVYGGRDSVRGYYEGEQAGDLGAALRLELLPPSWAALERVTLQPMAFVDTALLRRLYALAGERVSTRMASAGLGLRLQTTFGLQATLDWANLLVDTTRLDSTRASQEAVNGRGAGRTQRWNFSLRQGF